MKRMRILLFQDKTKPREDKTGSDQRREDKPKPKTVNRVTCLRSPKHAKPLVLEMPVGLGKMAKKGIGGRIYIEGEG